MISFRHIAIAAATVLAAAAAPALAAAGVGPTPGHAPFPNPSVKYCQQLSVAGSPHWSLRGGHFKLGAGEAWALGHGSLDESNKTASGYLCQHVRPRDVSDRDVVLKAVGHYVFRSYANQPKGDLSGDVLRLTFKVVEDAYATHCELGAIAHVTLYGGDNGSRSNSVQINFPDTGKGQAPYPKGPAICTSQDRSYRSANATVHIPALTAAPAAVERIPGRR